MKKNVTGISTVLAILLMLVSAVLSGLVTYAWNMAPFLVEPPEEVVDLIITDANFQVGNARFFSATIMNPSHSTGGTNITDIYVTVEGQNRTSIRASQPLLPTILERGTTRTFNCSLVWGGFAGKTITVHAVNSNNTEAAKAVLTQNVKLQVDTDFSPSISVERFNVTVTNDNSVKDLNITSVLFDYDPVENVSTGYPITVPINRSVTFQCPVNWEGHVKPVVQVESYEGYSAEERVEVPSTVILQITKVVFNEANSTQVNITLHNSIDSVVDVDVNEISIKRGNDTRLVVSSLADPPLPKQIERNQTTTFVCFWNWTHSASRDSDIIIAASTVQGYKSSPRVERTPLVVAGRINEVGFDLSDTETFVVNITNLQYSLEVFNVTRIDVNQTSTAFNSTQLAPGATSVFTCFYNWSTIVGEDATVTVYMTYNTNQSLFNYTLRLPFLVISGATFLEMSPGNHYVNATVRNSVYSDANVTVTRIFVKANNLTFTVAENLGCLVAKGSESTILFPWNWSDYAGQDVAIIVQIADGYQVSETFRAE